MENFAVLVTGTLFLASMQFVVVSTFIEQGGGGMNRVKKLPDLYWNSSNSIFRIDNTDHIIDVNEGRSGNNPMEYDLVNIVCPLYNKRLVPNEDDTEKFVIYHVNREEYDMCRIMDAHPRIIAVCDRPYSLRYFTISFRSFSPTPGALEFHPGKDYHFISTSSMGDLHRRQGGMCRSHNMRVVFKVSDGSTTTDRSIVLPTTSTSTTTPPPAVLFEEPSSSNTKSGGQQHKKNKRKKSMKKESLLSDMSDHDKSVLVGRQEPKSLDYFLYQTREGGTGNNNEGEAELASTNTNEIVKDNKRVVKQEASTRASAAHLQTLSLVSLLLWPLLLLAGGH